MTGAAGRILSQAGCGEVGRHIRPTNRAQISPHFLGSYIRERNPAIIAWTHARSRQQCLAWLMMYTS